MKKQMTRWTRKLAVLGIGSAMFWMVVSGWGEEGQEEESNEPDIEQGCQNNGMLCDAEDPLCDVNGYGEPGTENCVPCGIGTDGTNDKPKPAGETDENGQGGCPTGSCGSPSGTGGAGDGLKGLPSDPSGLVAPNANFGLSMGNINLGNATAPDLEFAGYLRFSASPSASVSGLSLDSGLQSGDFRMGVPSSGATPKVTYHNEANRVVPVVQVLSHDTVVHLSKDAAMGFIYLKMYDRTNCSSDGDAFKPFYSPQAMTVPKVQLSFVKQAISGSGSEKEIVISGKVSGKDYLRRFQHSTSSGGQSYSVETESSKTETTEFFLTGENIPDIGGFQDADGHVFVRNISTTKRDPQTGLLSAQSAHHVTYFYGSLSTSTSLGSTLPDGKPTERLLAKTMKVEGEDLDSKYRYDTRTLINGVKNKAYGQLLVEVKPDGTWQRWDYDVNGRVKRIIKPLRPGHPNIPEEATKNNADVEEFTFDSTHKTKHSKREHWLAGKLLLQELYTYVGNPAGPYTLTTVRKLAKPVRMPDGSASVSTNETTEKVRYGFEEGVGHIREEWIDEDGLYYFNSGINLSGHWNPSTKKFSVVEMSAEEDFNATSNSVLGPFQLQPGQGQSAHDLALPLPQGVALVIAPHRTKWNLTVEDKFGSVVHDSTHVAVSSVPLSGLGFDNEESDWWNLSTSPFKLVSSTDTAFNAVGERLEEYQDGVKVRSYIRGGDTLTVYERVTHHPDNQESYTKWSRSGTLLAEGTCKSGIWSFMHHLYEPRGGDYFGWQIKDVPGTSFSAPSQTAPLETKVYDVIGRLVEEKSMTGPQSDYDYQTAARVRDRISGGVTYRDSVDENGMTTRSIVNGASSQVVAKSGRQVTNPASGWGKTGILMQGGQGGASNSLCQLVVQFEQNGSASESAQVRHRGVDGLGRTVLEAVNVAGQTEPALTQTTYDAGGRVQKIERTGRVAELFVYDAFGELAAHGYDSNQDGVLAQDGSEPCTLHVTEYVARTDYSGAQAWWRQETEKKLTGTASQAGQPAPSLLTKRRTKMADGGSPESNVVEPNGNTTHHVVSYSSSFRYERTLQGTTDGNSQSTAVVSGRTYFAGLPSQEQTLSGTTTYAYVNLQRLNSQSGPAGSWTYGYDALGRRTSATDSAGNATSWSYYPDVAGDVKSGRIHKETRPGNLSVEYDYDDQGRIKTVGGAASYPAAYEYTALGQMKKLTTWRQAGDAATASVTEWLYDPASSMLTAKKIDGVIVAAYTYHPSGRLHTRTDARNIVTTYGYDSFGQLLTIDYGDDTPDVTYQYDIAGRLGHVSDGPASRTLIQASTNGTLSKIQYDAESQLAGAVVNLTRNASTFDQVGNISLSVSGAGWENFSFGFHHGTGQVYLATVGDVIANHGSSWVPTPGLAGTVAYQVSNDNEGNPIGPWGGFYGTRTQDAHKRISSVTWKAGTSTRMAFNYTQRDALNRVQTREDLVTEGATGSVQGTTVWNYQYNARGEVDLAEKKQAGQQNALPGYSTDYEYDDLGNLETRTESVLKAGAEAIAESDTVVWATNNKHQYEGRTNPDPARRLIKGTTTTTTSVAAAQRDVQSGTQENLPVHLNLSSWYGFSNTSANTEFRAFAAVASKGVGDGPKVLEVATTGGKTISGQNQSISSRGLLYLPPKQEAFGYDANGNLTSDSLWQYRWDAENRLKEMETTATAVAAGYPATKLAFQYDSQHRRVRKAVYRKLAGAGSWQLTRDLRFLYDEWNLIAEIAVIPGTNQKKLLRTYAWGPDISGSRQGAGGVAGLLIVKQYLATGGFKYLAPTYDANGNIMAYYDLETKQAVYRFESDAFGREITFEQGPAGNQPSEVPPFRFSTKYTDGETGLVYYGFRYYQPETGRWLSRDPIGERGGVNLYGMVGNDAVNRWDYLGKSVGVPPPGPNGYDMTPGPSPLDQFAPPIGPNNGDYVPNEKWFEGFKHQDLETAKKLATHAINIAIKPHCCLENKPTTVTVNFSYNIPPIGKYEEEISPGNLWLYARNVKISWSRNNWTFQAELFATDGLGLDTNPNNQSDWERDYADYLQWLFPARNIERGRWRLSGKGVCKP